MITPVGIVIHHTGHPTWGFEETRKFHINDRGWSDIGYNYFVEKNGTVKVSRGMEQGAHVKGHNHELLGYGFAGNFDEQIPTKAQYLGAANHMVTIMVKYGLTEDDITKHSDYKATSCPGKNFDMTYFKTIIKSMLPHAKDLMYLHNAGVLANPEIWIAKLDEPMPVWASMAINARILKIFKEER